MRCSENTQNIYDHDIEADGDFNAGIRLIQGNPGNPDGNRFSNNGTAFDIWSNAQPFERFSQNSLPNSLFDFTGREIKRQKLVANQSQVQWQTDQLQSGLYLISIYADNRLVWKTKVSVQK